jgi:adenine-specific DNA-methyltransferase
MSLSTQNGGEPKVDSDKNYSVYYRPSDRGLIVSKEAYGLAEQQLINDGYVKYFSHSDGRLVENTYSESKFRELFDQRALDFSEDKIYEKNFKDSIRIKSQLVNREYEAVIKGTKKKYSMELTTTGAGTYIKNLFEVTESPFSSPKNIGFIKILISLFEIEQFIVLDFFAGSSTTADAVMTLNSEDGGNRKFIMVQLPESLDDNLEIVGSAPENKTIKSAISICKSIDKPCLLTEISKERIRRAGKKILEGKCNENWDKDVSFRTLKIDTSNMADVYYTPDALDKANLDLFVDNIKPDRTSEDLLFQVMLDWGVDLALPITKQLIQGKDVLFVDRNVLAACFAPSGSIDEAFVKELAKHKPLRVVFRDAGYKNSAVKINVEQIFKESSSATEVKCI